MYLILIALMACGPSKEDVAKEVLASAEIQKLLQEKDEEIQNLKTMAKCLSKVSGYSGSSPTLRKLASKYAVRKCGEIGQSTEARKTYEEEH